MTYQLQPGTIPHRVYNWLRSQPAGAEFASGVIAEELGIDPANIVPCLKTPYNHGVINGRQDDRRLWHWSLGDGVPRAKPADHEPDEPLKETASKPAPAKVAKPKAAKTTALVAEAAPDPEHFRVGYFSDGSFLIEAGDRLLELNRDQAKILAAFISGGQH